MPQAMHQTVRRSLLAAGGTLVGAMVAGKYLWPRPKAEEAAPAPASQPISALHASKAALPPALRFADPDGRTRLLSDYAGQGVVLNFWATWCMPCVAEMPGLDALSRALTGRGIVVLPVSEDHGGAAAVRPFYERRRIASLPVLLDPQSEAMTALRLDGIPTTLVIDRHGSEVARVQGAVRWEDPAAAALITRLVG